MYRHQQEIALRIARRVRAKQLAAAAGRRQLALEAGIAEGSAKIIIEVYQRLCSGQLFKRHLSRTDMSFFLDSFGSDNNPVELSTALHALRFHIAWREQRNVSQRSNRQILAEQEERLRRVSESKPVNLSEIAARFASRVQDSLNDQSIERKKRLEGAEKIPRKVTRLVYVYERNPDVVAEVLEQAKGICARCGQAAPFPRRSNGTPYLEVHHKTMLSAGGEDTVENAEALCANCHRYRHYGIAV